MNLSLDSKRFKILLHLFFWAILTIVAYTLVRAVTPSDFIVVRTLMNVSFQIIIFYVNAKLLVNHFLENKKYVVYVASAISLFILIYFLRRLTDMYITKLENPTEDFLVLKNRLKSFYGGGLGFMLLFSTMYQLVENRYKNERLQEQKKQSETLTKLQYLRSQINPHLMFNMLNNIYSLVTINSPKAPAMILSLSELLRYSLYTTDEGKAFLTDEIMQIRRYISIMQIKNEEKLNVKFETKGDFENKKILPMLFLPLVENCFKHSNIEENAKGYIFIELEIKNDVVLFKTMNSKAANKIKEVKNHSEIGIENIKNRLAIIDKEHKFIYTDNDYFYEVELSLSTWHD